LPFAVIFGKEVFIFQSVDSNMLPKPKSFSNALGFHPHDWFCQNSCALITEKQMESIINAGKQLAFIFLFVPH